MTPLNKELRIRVLVSRPEDGPVSYELSVYNGKGKPSQEKECFESLSELNAVLSARYNTELAQPCMYPLPRASGITGNRWYYTSAGETAYLYLMWYRPADLPLVKTVEGRIEHG